MAVLWHPATPGDALWLRQAQIADRVLGVELQELEARSPNDFDRVLAAMTAKRAGALLLAADIMFLTHR